MIKAIKSFIQKNKDIFEASGEESTRNTFRDELNFESGKIFFVLLITSIIMLPYIINDLKLHQYPWLVIPLRIGFSALSIAMILLKYTKRFKHDPLNLLMVMVAYLYIAIGIYSASAGQHASIYLGAFAFVLTIPVFAPFPLRFKVIGSILSIVTFFITGTFIELDYSSPHVLYGINGIITSLVLCLVFSFSQNRLRYGAWEQNKKTKELVSRGEEDFQEIIELSIKAEVASLSKSEFLANMSHEIRTPMNVILGVTEIQLQEETISPSIRESYMMIYNSGNLLLGIINDILDLSKIEAGKMELVPARYEVASLINDTVQLNIMRNKSKQIKFELDIDENVPLELVGDEIRIKQILNNLLSNAFKYTDKGEVKLSISTENRKEDDYAVLIFEISDTGQGMTQEQANKLFITEYVRFNLEANRTVEGTGLGINITNHLVQMMNGKISVESELGKGTKFSVRLPQKKINSRVLGKEQTESLMQLRVQDSSRSKRVQFVREYMPYGNVLIVDDVETNLHVTRGLMAPYGLSIELVSSGYEAIEKVKNGKVYDIIFMDHMMPGMDGIEATKIIRELGYTQPVVALTANALIGQVKIFMDNGFNDFISKPIDIRQLNNVLNKLIRDKQTPEVIAEARRQKDEKAKYVQVMQAADAALQTIFVRDAKNALQVFESTIKNLAGTSDDDLHLYAVKAHAIKSALANIGEMTLSQMAFTLEKAGKERNRGIIEHKTQGLIDALESIIERSESEKKSTENEEDADYLRCQLRTISEACADYDIDSANDALTNLSKMSWTNETKELLEQIAGHLLHSDFEEAGSLANNRIGL